MPVAIVEKYHFDKLLSFNYLLIDSPETNKLADSLSVASKLSEIKSASITTLLRACDPTESSFCI